MRPRRTHYDADGIIELAAWSAGVGMAEFRRRHPSAYADARSLGVLDAVRLLVGDGRKLSPAARGRGRPRADGGPAKRRTVSLDEDTYVIAGQLSDALGIPISKVVARALNELVAGVGGRPDNC